MEPENITHDLLIYYDYEVAFHNPSLYWNPQMKSFILDIKMDSELNSVSQNFPVFTLRCKFNFELQWVRMTDPTSDQRVKTLSIVLSNLMIK